MFNLICCLVYCCWEARDKHKQVCFFPSVLSSHLLTLQMDREMRQQQKTLDSETFGSLTAGDRAGYGYGPRRGGFRGKRGFRGGRGQNK